MTHSQQERPRTSILRWTRTMSGPLRHEFPVEATDPADELTELLEQADRRLQRGPDNDKR